MKFLPFIFLICVTPALLVVVPNARGQVPYHDEDALFGPLPAESSEAQLNGSTGNESALGEATEQESQVHLVVQPEILQKSATLTNDAPILLSSSHSIIRMPEALPKTAPVPNTETIPLIPSTVSVAAAPAITPIRIASSIPGLELVPVAEASEAWAPPSVASGQKPAGPLADFATAGRETVELESGDQELYAAQPPAGESRENVFGVAHAAADVPSPITHPPMVPPNFVPQANGGELNQGLLSPYHLRSSQIVSVPANDTLKSTAIEPGFQPWWRQQVVAPIGLATNNAAIPVTLDDLLRSALHFSPHIQVAATEPHILQTSVFEESARFDWVRFLESKYDDQNDPVGNSLTTGNDSSRFTQQEAYSRGGARRTNTAGGELEIAQRLGTMNNNSRFLIPPNQGNSRLELNYRQPLMRNRGKAVNESVILLADIDYRSAGDDFLGKLQNHLAEVTEIYWELVRARSEYLQRQKLLASAEAILANLQGRSEVDTLDRQIYRAQAAVAGRRAEIARSRTSIRNSESRLRLMVNEPNLINARGMEFLPVDLPMVAPGSFDSSGLELADALSTALQHRTDISRSIREVSAANVRLGVAKNDALPQLDLVVGSYVAGLDGDSDAFNSWVRQFRNGRPGFNVGFEFEMPSGNRAARAREQRRRWEVTRSLHQFRSVVETGLTEVELAVREVETARRELEGRYYAMVAANNETEYLLDRWVTLPGLEDSPTLLLEDLLESQERLANEEAAYSRAQFDYANSTVQLKLAMGTLFQVQQREEAVVMNQQTQTRGASE